MCPTAPTEFEPWRGSLACEEPADAGTDEASVSTH